MNAADVSELMMKMKAHMWDLSISANVYCMWGHMLQEAMQVCQLVDKSELMKMKAQMWDLSNPKHTHHP